MTTLRPYQIAAVSAASDAIRAGKRRILIVAPTGAGKTVIATEGVIRPSVANSHRVLVIAHRTELIEQCAAKLAGLRVGIIKAGYAPDHGAPVQVASIQSLIRRFRPSAGLVVVDEAHHTTADNSYATILAEYPTAPIVGLTATPYRLDGRGLGKCFDALIPVASVAELIRLQFLVPVRTFAMPPPDLSHIRTVHGDWAQPALASCMDTPRIGTALVETYQRHAMGRSAIAFSVSVVHARNIAEQFNAAGISAEFVSGETSADNRAAILERLANGTTLIVSNCGVLTEGFDCPRVSCIILARPTKSRSLWRQMVGRGLRTFDGKSNCQIHDHAGCRVYHGDVTDDESASLLDGVKHRPMALGGTRQCPECYAVLEGGTVTCPECGYEFPARAVSEIAGAHVVLEEAAGPVVSPLGKKVRDQYLHQMIAVAVRRSWKAGAVAHKFKEKFGEWPCSVGKLNEMYEWERKQQLVRSTGGAVSLAELDLIYEKA